MLGRRLETLADEHEFLTLHARNLQRGLEKEVGHTRELKREVERLGREKAEIERAYQAVINSHVWRAFGPYRAFRRVLRGLLRS